MSRIEHHADWDDVLATRPEVARWWAWATAQGPGLMPPDEWVVCPRWVTLSWRDDPSWLDWLRVDIYTDGRGFDWVCEDMHGCAHSPRLVKILESLT